MSENSNLQEAQAEESIDTAKVPKTLHLKETSAEVAMEWKIENFFPVINIVDYGVESPDFTASDAKLCLQIYPNGYTDDGTTGWVCFYMVRSESLIEHPIEYTLGIKKLDGSVFKSYSDTCVMTGSVDYGGNKLLKTSELRNAKNEVSLNNSLTVFCTVRIETPIPVELPDVLEADTQTSSSQRTDTFTRNMKDLLLDGKYADAIFQVKDRKFPVHKVILSARSPVFGPMFDHDMIEKETGVVNIDDCEPEIFHDFLIFCYTGSLQHVTSDNAPDLYKLADKYDLDELKAECSRCIERELSVDSFCEVVLFASIYNESGLLKSATHFFVKNLKNILPTQNWQTFLKDHHLLANELFIHLANKN